MSLTLESSRFGRVQIDPQTVVQFPDGLIGLGGSRYALLATSSDSPFSVELTEADAERLGLDDVGSVDVYVTVRAAAAQQEFTANLRAPLLISNGCGHQVINQAEGCQLRARLFPEDGAESAC